MAAKYDGGAAHPHPTTGGVMGYPARPEGHTGMSLRDYFAAKAMEAAMIGATLPGLHEGNPDALAAVDAMAAGVYRIADAMLKARIA